TLHVCPYPSTPFLSTDPAPSETYTLSLHDALPILSGRGRYRLPLQPDHGDLGHARAAVPREHDREPAGAARRPHGRCPLCLPHRSEEHTSELQSQSNLVCRLLLEKKKKE